jgi:hypothetical protein
MSHQREEACGGVGILILCEVKAEESGRMELAEAAQEGAVRDEPEPAPAYSGGADEASGEANADDDLGEKVLIVEHIGHTRR